MMSNLKNSTTTVNFSWVACHGFIHNAHRSHIVVVTIGVALFLNHIVTTSPLHDKQPEFTVQGFAESLQHDSSNQSEIVVIKLYCCGPAYCSIYPLLYYFFQIRNGLGSSVFKLCCKDSAKPCILCYAGWLSCRDRVHSQPYCTIN